MDALLKLLAIVLACSIIGVVILGAAQLLALRRAQDQGEDAFLFASARNVSAGKGGSVQSETVEELTGLDMELADAGISLSKGCWQALRIACSFATGVGVFVITQCNESGSGGGLGMLMACIVAVSVFFAFNKILRKRSEQRRLLLERQLAHMELHIAENSRSGLSTGRTILACAELADEPLKGHLQRLYNEITYSNLTLAEGFDNMAKRTKSDDVRVLAEVINIQQQTGSNLADAMIFLHETISRRLEMRQTLKSSLAETKITKSIVAVTPWAIFALLSFAPIIKISGFWEFYSTNMLGWIVLAACAVAEAGILLLISRIANLKLD